MSGCSSVGADEKMRVYDRIMSSDAASIDDEKPVEKQSNSTAREAIEPDAVQPPAEDDSTQPEIPQSSAPEPAKPESKTDSSSAQARPPAGARPQMPARQAVARLPLPRGVNHSDLLQFMGAHFDVIRPYQPLQKEWEYYQAAFKEGTKASEVEMMAMRVRVAENFPRAHWLFVWGLQQTSFRLLGRGDEPKLILDRVDDFLARMSLLMFLASELQAASRRSEYFDTLKKFYKHANNQYFKRPLTDRSRKPAGILRPEKESKPQLPEED